MNRRIEIIAKGAGRGVTVKLEDGTDLSGAVTGVDIRIRAGEAPTAILHYADVRVVAVADEVPAVQTSAPGWWSRIRALFGR